jgi:hypothetical protein
MNPVSADIFDLKSYSEMLANFKFIFFRSLGHNNLEGFIKTNYRTLRIIF